MSTRSGGRARACLALVEAFFTRSAGIFVPGPAGIFVPGPAGIFVPVTDAARRSGSLRGRVDSARDAALACAIALTGAIALPRFGAVCSRPPVFDVAASSGTSAVAHGDAVSTSRSAAWLRGDA